MNKFDINISYLISSEQENEINIDWKVIIVIPFYKWILEKV